MSLSGYYAWRHRRQNPGRRQMEREKLDSLMAQAFEIRKGHSGSAGLTLDPDELVHKYDHKTLATRMKRQGLVAKAAKKFKATTDSDHNLPVAPNRLEQDLRAQASNQKWVCGITYYGRGRLAVPGRGAGPLLPHGGGLSHG